MLGRTIPDSFWRADSQPCPWSGLILESRTGLDLPSASACTALRRYVKRRNDYFRRGDIEPFFVSRHGTRMLHADAWKSLVRLSRKIGLRGPSDRRGPRLHDFRHRAAVQAMLHCYRSGADPERRLPALSTYLGHSNLRHTYWYLHQNPALMKQAVGRLERCWERST